MRYAVITLAALVAGPKILLLLPVWLCGVVAYYWSDRLSVLKRFSSILFWLSFAVIVMAICKVPSKNPEVCLPVN